MKVVYWLLVTNLLSYSEYLTNKILAEETNAKHFNQNFWVKHMKHKTHVTSTTTPAPVITPAPVSTTTLTEPGQITIPTTPTSPTLPGMPTYTSYTSFDEPLSPIEVFYQPKPPANYIISETIYEDIYPKKSGKIRIKPRNKIKKSNFKIRFLK